jgi:hypothetical protein
MDICAGKGKGVYRRIYVFFNMQSSYEETERWTLRGPERVEKATVKAFLYSWLEEASAGNPNH